MLVQLIGDAPGGSTVDAARVVRSVGGLPLGIELCARLASVLPLGEVARGLGDRVLGLGAGSGSPPLRAAFDWIVERADPGDVAVFSRLSAFRGPFTLRSAEHVVDLGDLTAPVVASLGHLVESSLVRAAGRDPAAYHLDVVQACYAAEMSARNGEQRGAGGATRIVVPDARRRADAGPARRPGNATRSPCSTSRWATTGSCSVGSSPPVGAMRR